MRGRRRRLFSGEGLCRLLPFLLYMVSHGDLDGVVRVESVVLACVVRECRAGMFCRVLMKEA